MNYLESLNKNYNVGIYIRLSREDDDKVHESESIKNQKSLLMQYIKENDLRVYDIYIDDGYSGTNFNRPGFQRLINDIEHKKVNMVITKDMSRLGRDYIGTGEYLEKYFPEHDVRYIAITDDIDTFLDNSNNDIAPFKAIMNDFYAKDISKKIKSSLKAKMKEGKFVGGRTPFGYIRDPENKNHLVVYEGQAEVVRRIYQMSLEGMTYFKIAKTLTNENVKTPAQYYNFEWKSNYDIKFGEWHAKTIQDILTNRMYIGDLVQNKRNKVNYKVKRIVKNNPNEYIVVENTHEPIIDPELFYEVQKKLPKNVGRNEKKETHLLDGLLYCGDCGHRISVTARRKRDNNCYTICNYYRSYMKEKRCTTHSNNYDNLEQCILNRLRELCLEYIDTVKIKKNINNVDFFLESKDNENKIITIKKKITQINEHLDSIYMDKLNGVVSLEQFERMKIKLESDLEIKKNMYQELIDNKQNMKNKKEYNKKIDIYINNFLSMKEPSRELIVNLIDKVEIFNDKRINIHVTFISN